MLFFLYCGFYYVEIPPVSDWELCVGRCSNGRFPFGSWKLPTHVCSSFPHFLSRNSLGGTVHILWKLNLQSFGMKSNT